MFRSKYAAEEIETYVEFLFSWRGKSYQVIRNPEYLARKKRGTGYTVRKSDATLVYPDERQPVTKAKEVTRQSRNFWDWITGSSRRSHDRTGRFPEASAGRNSTAWRDLPAVVPYRIISEPSVEAERCGENAMEAV